MIDYSNIYGQIEPESKTSWIVRIVHKEHVTDSLEEILWEKTYRTSTAAKRMMNKQLTYFLTRTPEFAESQEELDFDE